MAPLLEAGGKNVGSVNNLAVLEVRVDVEVGEKEGMVSKRALGRQHRVENKKVGVQERPFFIRRRKGESQSARGQGPPTKKVVRTKNGPVVVEQRTKKVV